jgi:hypothetical protein
MEKGKNSKGFIESLTDFLSDPAGLSQEDIVTELQEQGIDTDQLEKSVMEIVKEGSEKRRLAWRERARERQAKIEQLLNSKQIVIEASNLKNKIMDILQGTYGPDALSHAEAYFRKRDKVSEKDLESLIEDLEALNLLEEANKESKEKD